MHFYGLATVSPDVLIERRLSLVTMIARCLACWLLDPIFGTEEVSK